MTVQTQTTLAPATPEAAAAEAAPIAPAPAAAAAAARVTPAAAAAGAVAACMMTGNQLADFFTNLDQELEELKEVERDMVAAAAHAEEVFRRHQRCRLRLVELSILYRQTLAPPAGVARKPR